METGEAGPAAQEQAIRALNSTSEGIGHAEVRSQKERGQGHHSVRPGHLPQRKCHQHTLPSSYFPFPLAVSMAMVMLLVNKKTVFPLSKVTCNETPLPVLFPGIFTFEGQSHHPSQPLRPHS